MVLAMCLGIYSNDEYIALLCGFGISVVLIMIIIVDIFKQKVISRCKSTTKRQEYASKNNESKNT